MAGLKLPQSCVTAHLLLSLTFCQVHGQFLTGVSTCWRFHLGQKIVSLSSIECQVFASSQRLLAKRQPNVHWRVLLLSSRKKERSVLLSPSFNSRNRSKHVSKKIDPKLLS